MADEPEGSRAPLGDRAGDRCELGLVLEQANERMWLLADLGEKKLAWRRRLELRLGAHDAPSRAPVSGSKRWASSAFGFSATRAPRSGA
jgi:hypothetical protein